MSLLREVEHLKKCPLEVWQVVRISSSSTPTRIFEETVNMESGLNELMKYTPFKVKASYSGRKIYLKKERRQRILDSTYR